MTKETNNFDQPQSLMQKTIALVRKHGIEQACLQTGLPYHWMRKFSSGAYHNPSVNRVQHAYEKLTNTKLF